MLLSAAALNEVEKKASFLLKSATPLKACSDFRNDCLFRSEAIFSNCCHLVYEMEGFNLSPVNTSFDWVTVVHLTSENVLGWL